MVRLPVTPRRFRRHVAGGFATLSAVAVIVTISLMGLPQRLWLTTAEAASRAGFEVRHIELQGVANSPRLGVYTAALEGPTNSMLLVDLNAVRARLRALPWVADASVARRLPDTLLVAIVERKPAALWQYRQRLMAIDKTGRPLTSERLDRFPSLPLVVGPEANAHVQSLIELLADHPRLGSRIDAATFIGLRRWDLRFKSGETLALPEGDAAAGEALNKFETLDQKSGLLSKGFTRFDMRIPGRMTVRVAGGVKAAPATKVLAV
ncbi:MAG: cell division protein FtsQ/DivIB [Janthinobacterium lividum]